MIANNRMRTLKQRSKCRNVAIVQLTPVVSEWIENRTNIYFSQFLLLYSIRFYAVIDLVDTLKLWQSMRLCGENRIINYRYNTNNRFVRPSNVVSYQNLIMFVMFVLHLWKWFIWIFLDIWLNTAAYWVLLATKWLHYNGTCKQWKVQHICYDFLSPYFHTYPVK